MMAFPDDKVETATRRFKALTQAFETRLEHHEKACFIR